MKYVIIIPDGAADLPIRDLENKTAFEFAKIPNMDALAKAGRIGTVATTPDAMPCGSDVCSMSLLGYDPAIYHTGRAPLEAAALGIPLGDDDWIFRVNFVTVIDGKMQDHSAGHITDNEAKTLLADFVKQADLPGTDVTLYPGVSYRNILVDASGADYSELVTTPPHDVPGESMDKYRPVGGNAAKLMNEIVMQSEQIFANHEINATRREMGELPATHLWPWGQGTKPQMPNFKEKYGLSGAMITAVDLLAGISSFIGWDRLDVPGQTSYHDNDYTAAATHAIAALDAYDIVCVHIEAPDEASHAADPQTKVAAIEAIDEHIVGPIRHSLESRDEPYRILILPDHYTRVDNRKHDPTPVPFLIAGEKIASIVDHDFNEANAQAADLHIEFGHELMDYFLNAGL
ncbi:cofactor-independent phosphoglycerate mutase [Poriferisphaera sp. WC338]|uniref:cofactor-independent phosphoglycerate mutase n=1 Tax=Poriferisphaera sp. WC338 TaxID=3425129 RepID=UPI003D8149A6